MIMARRVFCRHVVLSEATEEQEYLVYKRGHNQYYVQDGTEPVAFKELRLSVFDACPAPGKPIANVYNRDLNDLVTACNNIRQIWSYHCHYIQQLLS